MYTVWQVYCINYIFILFQQHFVQVAGKKLLGKKSDFLFVDINFLADRMNARMNAKFQEDLRVHFKISRMYFNNHNAVAPQEPGTPSRRFQTQTLAVHIPKCLVPQETWTNALARSNPICCKKELMPTTCVCATMYLFYCV